MTMQDPTQFVSVSFEVLPDEKEGEERERVSEMRRGPAVEDEKREGMKEAENVSRQPYRGREE